MIPKLGELLIAEGVVDAETVDAALEECRVTGALCGRCLIERFSVEEEAVYRALARQFSLPFLAEIDNHIDRGLLRELPRELFAAGRCFPLEVHDAVMRVAAADPLDLDLALDIRQLTGYITEMVVTTPSRLEAFREQAFSGESVFKDSVGKISREYERRKHRDEGAWTEDEIRARTESEPVVRMVSLLFDEAIEKRASDIHIEPSEESAAVRFRIDGMLHRHMDISRWMYIPVTSRIKILADLDIAEKRVPQDGRIRHAHNGAEFDFRVSTLPTHHGEKTVVRILKHDRALLELINLGLPSATQSTLDELIRKPQGMLFVTGPTGSGKSSTLFACLNAIRSNAINITTIENPIEYKLPGVNQVQINEKAGVTFATTLRSILRQDPDVILIGEIRDRETAEIAIQASQTGHLVFSTLHTNDAVSAITRLKDLGVPSFMIASSLLGILGQRLVRLLCPDCRREREITDEMRARWAVILGDLRIERCFEPVGCTACGQSGFLGRSGIFELVTVNEAVRQLIAEDIAESSLRRQLREHGMRTMLESGVEKVAAGVTTPEELLRVASIDDTAW
jgi:type IV pilus assembly protein PilB